jgi:hypothetical protein
MQLKALKSILQTQENMSVQMPDGSFIPAHYHITELGLNTRHFIDCGGTVRAHSKANFQVWVANDTGHRLSAAKLSGIIRKAEKVLELAEDLEIEVEYQQATIGKYDLHYKDGVFQLVNTKTACLAEDACGIPEAQQSSFISLEAMSGSEAAACCSPQGGCC